MVYGGFKPPYKVSRTRTPLMLQRGHSSVQHAMLASVEDNRSEICSIIPIADYMEMITGMKKVYRMFLPVRFDFLSRHCVNPI